MSTVQSLNEELWVLLLVGGALFIVGFFRLLYGNLWGLLPLFVSLSILAYSIIVYRKLKAASLSLAAPHASAKYSELIIATKNGDEKAAFQLRSLVDHGALTGGTYLGACRSLASYYEQRGEFTEAKEMATRVLVKFAGDAEMRRLLERLEENNI